MSIQNLVEPLPMALQSAFQEASGADQTPVIALPGHYGQAVVATAKQLFLLKEGPAGSGVKSMTFALPISQKVILAEQGGNGMLSIEGVDGASIAFPSFYMDRFRSAVNAINAGALPASAPAPATSIAGAMAQPGALACPACGAAVRGADVFCSQCGKQVAQVCAHCRGIYREGDKYCPTCGRPAKPRNLNCPKCQARIAIDLVDPYYCPSCGTMLVVRCAGCGATLNDDWNNCPLCGRKLGTNEGLSTRPSGSSAILGGQAAASRLQAEPAPSAPSISSSDEAELYNQRGAEHYEAERYDEAIAMFGEAARRNPGNTLYRCNLAVALGEAGQEEEAFREFEKVLDINPDDITALLNLGYMYSERERKPDAKRCWEKVVRLSPDSSEGEEARENLEHLDEV